MQELDRGESLPLAAVKVKPLYPIGGDDSEALKSESWSAPVTDWDRPGDKLKALNLTPAAQTLAERREEAGER